jgi:hypothetical protein
MIPDTIRESCRPGAFVRALGSSLRIDLFCFFERGHAKSCGTDITLITIFRFPFFVWCFFAYSDHQTITAGTNRRQKKLTVQGFKGSRVQALSKTEACFRRSNCSNFSIAALTDYGGPFKSFKPFNPPDRIRGPFKSFEGIKTSSDAHTVLGMACSWTGPGATILSILDCVA